MSTRRRAGWTLLATVAGCLLGVGTVWMFGRLRPVEAGERLDVVTVRRADVVQTVVVAGDVAGKKETVLECELEDLTDPEGRATAEKGIVLTEIVPEGTRIMKGEVVCRFDSRRYTERLRRQKIAVEKAVAEEAQARYELEAAEAALRAYRDGEARQIDQQLQGQLALAESDLVTAQRRLEFSEKLQRLGYVSHDQVHGDRSTVLRLTVDRDKGARAIRIHRDYTAPKTVRERELDVESARFRASSAAETREVEEKRLAHYEELVGLCTVRAPHDGLVVHVGAAYLGQDPLAAGTRVFEEQPLVILPDLAHPVVEVALHEAVASRVEPGQVARVWIPAVSSEPLVGRVAKRDVMTSDQWRAWTEFKGMRATIALEDPPAGLLPGLSARVEIETGRHPDALLVPRESVRVTEGDSVCYVVGPGGAVERRVVSLGSAGMDAVEVLDGLEEGEQVARDASHFRTGPEPALRPFPRRKEAPGRFATAPARPSIGRSS